MFDAQVIADIQQHALEAYPNESCGYIIAGQYLPKQNIAADPRLKFEISPGEYPLDGSLQAVVHSHPDGLLEPTRADMAGQIASAVPWGLVTVREGKASDPLWWGPGVAIPELVGRPYRHGPSASDGKGDCYALIRDYFKLKRGITLPDYPREGDDAPYLEHYEEAGFTRISERELQAGDVVLIQLRAKFPNHGGVYLGKGEWVHHAMNSLSRRDNLARYKHLMTHVLRYTG